MRYFFISDVHGNYEKMVAALEARHFDKEKDTYLIVSALLNIDYLKTMR